MKNKEPVRLRFKPLKNGCKSIYLDIYDKGRRYEFLRLYLIPERTALDKTMNAETMRMANSIKAQRIIALNNGRLGIAADGRKVRFFPYFEALAQKAKERTGKSNKITTLRYLHEYEKRDIMLGEITATWARGFLRYLSSRKQSRGDKLFSPNSIWLYWTHLRTAISKAYNDGLIPTDPLRGVERPKKVSSQRTFLTITELRSLAASPCPNDITRRIFLFSCLTGLRWSDCITLHWDMVEDTETGARIIFHQQKTGGLEYLDINQQARGYMGERSLGMVFYGHRLLGVVNEHIKQWAKDAGIRKHITFHCARHTFATMMLSLGTDIYVVSRLLGHRDIKTTQVYAHILDEQKREAIERIPQL